MAKLRENEIRTRSALIETIIELSLVFFNITVIIIISRSLMIVMLKKNYNNSVIFGEYGELG